MNIKEILALASEGLVIAGPLIERFALKDSEAGKAIIEGAHTLLDYARRAIGGAEDFSEELKALVEDFRELKLSGGPVEDDFHALADRIRANTERLRAVAGPDA